MRTALLLPVATLVLSGAAFANTDVATPAEAQERLKALVALIKTKGIPGATEDVMNADALKCKYKGMSCLLITDAGKFIINTAQPALVGNSLPMDLKDPDGAPILAAQVGPLKEGKTKWDAKFKFVVPGTKTIVPRWSFCEKAVDGVAACVVVNQP